MPSVTLQADPAASPGGDAVFRTESDGPLVAGSLESGINNTGKSYYTRGFMVRYDASAIPSGQQIDGFKFTFREATSDGGSNSNFYCGVLADDSTWTLSAGFSIAAYPRWTDLPRGALITTIQAAEFYDSNYYNFTFDVSTLGAQDPFSVAGGTLSGDIEPSGMLADVQGSFDDYSGIIGYQQVNTSNVGSTSMFDFYNQVNATYYPTLEIEYSDPNTDPVVAITAPATDPYSTSRHEDITFTATATDAEDGDISANVVWTSDVDGSLGTGASISTDALTIGSHVITATITDAGSAQDTDTITVVIAATGVITGRMDGIDVVAARLDGDGVVTADLDGHEVVHGRLDSAEIVSGIIDGEPVIKGRLDSQ